jgi:hypothetical protein
MKPVICDCCAGSVPLLTGADVYPHRPDLRDKPIWACMPCGAWVGCHPGTTNRLGRLANAQSRRLKMDAHAAFDPLWRSGNMTRKAAYAWLRDQLGITDRECHMGWMGDDLLRRVVEVCEGAGQ